MFGGSSFKKMLDGVRGIFSCRTTSVKYGAPEQGMKFTTFFPCATFSEKLLEYIQTVVIPSDPLEVRFKQNCLDELANKEG